jgi:uncharacterized protein
MSRVPSVVVLLLTALSLHSTSAFVPAAAASPSFTCSGHLLPTEAVICSDNDLASLDRQLAAVYDSWFKRLSAAQQAELKATEKTWVAERNSCGINKSCISNTYKVRISSLSGVQPPPTSTPAPHPTTAAAADSCRMTAPAMQRLFVSAAAQRVADDLRSEPITEADTIDGEAGADGFYKLFLGRLAKIF